MLAEWLRVQWNRPDRSDHYLMQIARGVFHTDKECRIEFEHGTKGPPLSLEDRVRRQKAAVRSAMGVRRGRDGAGKAGSPPNG